MGLATMFRGLFGSATVFVIFAYSLAALASIATAQEGVAVEEGVPVSEGVAVQEGVPVQAEDAPGEGVAVQDAPEDVVPAEADPEELTDDEIRRLLTEESLERFGQWKRRLGHRGSRECSEYDGVQGPERPEGVYCNPADVPAEQIELYRERQRQERSTFISEPQINF